MIYTFNPATMGTGLDSIDCQHKTLFELANRLEDIAHTELDRAGAGRALSALRNYALAHFVHEERMMDVYLCPLAKMNKDAHRVFAEKVREWFDRYKQCNSDDEVKELMLTANKYVGDWLGAHICRVDVGVKPFVHWTAPK